MTLQPLLDAPWSVIAHLATALPALLVGTWLVFLSRKGSKPHRWLGILFLGLMIATAVLTLFIHRRMPHSPLMGLSPFHLLAPFTAFGAWRALDGARKHNIKQHKVWVFILYYGLLVFAGVVLNTFAFPGITHDVFFGS